MFLIQRMNGCFAKGQGLVTYDSQLIQGIIQNLRLVDGNPITTISH